MGTVVRTKKPRKNIWADDYKPYGEHEGDFGNPSAWKLKYERVMGLGEAQEIIRERNPWTILGVALTATLTEIKTAFRKLALKLHPDHGGDEKSFRELYASYTVLISKFKNK